MRTQLLTSFSLAKPMLLTAKPPLFVGIATAMPPLTAAFSSSSIGVSARKEAKK